MNSFITIIIIGISLSMDAFSLALIYGTNELNNNKKVILSLIVGIFHFFMPLIGIQFGNLIDKTNLVSINLIASIILIYIGLDLIISSQKESVIINKIGSILFGFSVSIDSLTIGIGLKAITNNYLLTSTTFFLFSFIFTYSGLILGTIINKRVGKYSKKIGGIILIMLSIILFII